MDSIQDIFAQDIFAGNLIAISRGNSSEIQLAVVLGFRKSKNPYNFNPKINPLLKIVTFQHYWGNGKGKKSFVEVQPGVNANLIIVDASNLLFAINNKRIQEVLQSVDHAKHRKLLPQEYKLGQPIAEEQIWENWIK
jgi:hypothetical protein